MTCPRAALLGCVILAGLGTSALVGCAITGPKLEGGVYRDDDVAFRIGDIPAGWRAMHVDRATLAFRDEPHRASVLLDARCYRKDDDVPLVALTDHLIMGTTGRTIASQGALPFDGREAMRTRLTAKLDGVPMDYDIFVFKKDGCVYDFVYVGEPGAIDEGISPFERFVSTFHTLPSTAQKPAS